MRLKQIRPTGFGAARHRTNADLTFGIKRVYVLRHEDTHTERTLIHEADDSD
jgi:hypothetical protein